MKKVIQDVNRLISAGFRVVVTGDIPYGLKCNQTDRYKRSIDPKWTPEQFEGLMECIREVTDCSDSSVFLFGSDKQVTSRLPHYWEEVLGKNGEWEVFGFRYILIYDSKYKYLE